MSTILEQLMNNIKQSALLPAFKVTKTRMSQELVTELNELRGRTFETPEQEAAAREEMNKKLPADLQKELASFGVQLPTDPIEISVKLGSFLFDMYCSSEKAPVAPLAKLAFQKKLMELADALNKDEISLPEFAVGPIKSVLLDEKKWSAAAIVAIQERKVGEETVVKEVVITSAGAALFGNVIQAAAELMYQLDQAK